MFVIYPQGGETQHLTVDSIDKRVQQTVFAWKITLTDRKYTKIKQKNKLPYNLGTD